MADVSKFSPDGGLTIYNIKDTVARTVMTGASASSAGAAGQVPAPSAGDNAKFLRGDGAWVDASSGGGHVILNSSGNSMTQRSKLQFNGATVTDDSSNGKTIVTTTPQSMISDAWVSGHDYAVGDYCIYGNVLYKCKTAHTSSASYRPPYASYWDVVTVASQLGGNGGGSDWIKLYQSPDISVTSAFGTVEEHSLNINISQYSELESYVYIRESANGGKICVLKYGTREAYNYNGSNLVYNTSLNEIFRYIYSATFISTAKVITGYQLKSKWNSNVIGNVEIYAK